jgi:phage-related protein
MSGGSKQAMVLKPVLWMGNSRETLREFPDSVQDEVGFALFLAQGGGKHFWAKPLHGIEALEFVEDFDGDSYRAVYTVKLEGFIYVLHCFQKKSKHGIATPQSEIDLIKKRLKYAKEDHKARSAGPGR